MQVSGNWEYVQTLSIGGLFNVGFVPGTELVHVLSAQGESLIDCRSGSKIDRNRNGLDWTDRMDEASGIITGMGEFSTFSYLTSGVYGAEPISSETTDGWQIISRNSAKSSSPPKSKQYFLLDKGGAHQIELGFDGICEYRACGFSDSGFCVILASSCEIIIFSRPE